MSAGTEHVFLNAYRAKRHLTLCKLKRKSRELFFNVARERRLAGTGKVFLTTNKRQFTRRKISKALREKRVPARKHLWQKGFYGRSGILPLHFCYFFSQTPSAESATEHGNGNFPSKATMGKLKETKNFCLLPRKGEFFSRRFRRLRRFYGRSSILPLHFCYFFSQTLSAESATLTTNANPTGTRFSRSAFEIFLRVN